MKRFSGKFLANIKPEKVKIPQIGYIDIIDYGEDLKNMNEREIYKYFHQILVKNDFDLANKALKGCIIDPIFNS